MQQIRLAKTDFPRGEQPIAVAIDPLRLSESDKKELQFWEHDAGEGPDADIFLNLIYKARVMLTFRRAMAFLSLSGSETILEVGAGQGWASVILKRQHPSCYVVASDVSQHAIEVSAKYETVIGAKIDEKWACSADNMPFANDSFDVVFCFAAFHHFIIGNRYSETLNEAMRVLKPGGRLVMLFEPSSPPLFYKLTTMRVNKNRAHVAVIDEDVLQMAILRQEAQKLGASLSFEYFPDHLDRLGLTSTLYYWLLSKFRFLQPFLPCTVNATITRRD